MGGSKDSPKREVCSNTRISQDIIKVSNIQADLRPKGAGERRKVGPTEGREPRSQTRLKDRKTEEHTGECTRRMFPQSYWPGEAQCTLSSNPARMAEL